MVKEFYNNDICKWVCLVVCCLGLLDNVETFCLGKLSSLPEIILKAEQQTPAPNTSRRSYQCCLFIVPVALVMSVLSSSLGSEMQRSGLCLQGWRVLVPGSACCCERWCWAHSRGSAQEGATEHTPPNFSLPRCFSEAT